MSPGPALPNADDWSALARAAEALRLEVAQSSRPRRFLADIEELWAAAWSWLVLLALSLVEGRALRAFFPRPGQIAPRRQWALGPLWRAQLFDRPEPIETKARNLMVNTAAPAEPKRRHPAARLLAIAAICADPLGQARKLAAILRRRTRGQSKPTPAQTGVAPPQSAEPRPAPSKPQTPAQPPGPAIRRLDSG